MSTYAPSPSAYRASAVMTASSSQLVVMLYDGVHRFLHQASVAMSEHQIETAHRKLTRAEEIVRHLRNTLDMEQGLISQRLFAYLHLLAAADVRSPVRAGSVKARRRRPAAHPAAGLVGLDRGIMSPDLAPYEALAESYERELELVAERDFHGRAELMRDAGRAHPRDARRPPGRRAPGAGALPGPAAARAGGDAPRARGNAAGAR